MRFFNCKKYNLTFVLIVFLDNFSKGSSFVPIGNFRNRCRCTSNDKLSPLPNNVQSSEQGNYFFSFSGGFGRTKSLPFLTKLLLEKKSDTVEDNNEPKKLILGEEIQKKIMEIKSKYPTTEAAYLEAAKNRAMEYQKKKELGLIGDEEEASSSSEALLQGSDTSVNFGPEDLSNFKGFTDEGWEASLKQNDMATLLAGDATKGEQKAEKSETPTLLLFDSLPSDNDDGDRLLLI
jgi:hypothetical protein